MGVRAQQLHDLHGRPRDLAVVAVRLIRSVQSVHSFHSHPNRTRRLYKARHDPQPQRTTEFDWMSPPAFKGISTGLNQRPRPNNRYAYPPPLPQDFVLPMQLEEPEVDRGTTQILIAHSLTQRSCCRGAFHRQTTVRPLDTHDETVVWQGLERTVSGGKTAWRVCGIWYLRSGHLSGPQHTQLSQRLVTTVQLNTLGSGERGSVFATTNII